MGLVGKYRVCCEYRVESVYRSFVVVYVNVFWPTDTHTKSSIHGHHMVLENNELKKPQNDIDIDKLCMFCVCIGLSVCISCVSSFFVY